jgi:hypothetical protein
MPRVIDFARQARDTAVAEAPAPGVDDAGSLANFTHQLKRELRSRPEAQVIIENESVTVLRLTPQGPDVTAIISEGRCTLAIGAWHDDMDSIDVTLAYVRMAVEGDLRVRVDKLGGKPWKYALERRLEDGSWQEESVLELPRFPFLARQKTTHYLQNARVA